ncbi:MAG TPA: ChaN family lipoprotein [Fimbriimonadaceae bacterium]|nr:ChaN family lipoprotein [Fimbriimonadaceae bacterium]
MLALALVPVLTSLLADDPYLLPIGSKGRVTVSRGQIVQTSSGKAVDLTEVARAARSHRFIYIGESHDNAAHHQFQADLIEALAKDGRRVVVGFEMYTRPAQETLNPWTLGWWTEEEFIERSDWKKQWGFDFALYRPVFEVVKNHKLPMVALNVPREWVRSVGRGGYAALSEEQRKELPTDLHLGNQEHRQVFQALMGGHPMTGAQGENVYAAQVLWDEGMADTALKYLAGRRQDARTAFVVVAGNGHVMYGQGINYRVHRRTGQRGLTVVQMEPGERREVSRGLADFVVMPR